MESPKGWARCRVGPCPDGLGPALAGPGGSAPGRGKSCGSATALDREFAEAYQRGFVDALCAVAVAFGIRAPTTNRPMRQPVSSVCDNEPGRR